MGLTGNRVGDVVQQWTAVEISTEVFLEELGLPFEPADTSGGIVRRDADGRMRPEGVVRWKRLGPENV